LQSWLANARVTDSRSRNWTEGEEMTEEEYRKIEEYRAWLKSGPQEHLSTGEREWAKRRPRKYMLGELLASDDAVSLHPDGSVEINFSDSPLWFEGLEQRIEEAKTKALMANLCSDKPRDTDAILAEVRDIQKQHKEDKDEMQEWLASRREWRAEFVNFMEMLRANPDKFVTNAALATALEILEQLTR
jgi:hypothetical protein